MVRVLLVSPYSDNLVGGIVNWTRYIVNYHRSIESEVDLHLLNNINASSVSLSDNAIKRIIYGVKNYKPVLRGLKELLEKDKYDIVHICSSASLGLIRDLLLVRIARKRNVKTCIHFHFGRIPDLFKKRCWESTFLRVLIKKTDCVLVMDEASLNALKKHGFLNSVYLPNPFSLEIERLVNNCKVDKRDSNIVLYAGHVCPTKGVFELIEACREIGNVQLEIIGKETVPGTIDKINEIAGKNAETWVHLPGNRPIEDVIALMKRCGVFVLPSHTEGFPNVILESMACRCAIVATKVGAIPEMLAVDSVQPCGICVPIKDVKELRHEIMEMIHNPNMAALYGDRAYSRVKEQYSMPIVWRQLVDIWNTVALAK